MGRALHYVDVAAIVQVAMDGSSARSLMLACPSSCGRYSLLRWLVLSLTGVRFQPRLFLPRLAGVHTFGNSHM